MENTVLFAEASLEISSLWMSAGYVVEYNFEFRWKRGTSGRKGARTCRFT